MTLPPTWMSAEDRLENWMAGFVPGFSLDKTALREIVAAARADERVKAWNGALEAAHHKTVVQCVPRVRGDEPSIVSGLKLPEAQPVERISEADHKTLDTLHREGSY